MPRYKLRTLLILLAVGPPLVTQEPLAIVVNIGFAISVVAALTVEAIDCIASRVSRWRQ